MKNYLILLLLTLSVTLPSCQKKDIDAPDQEKLTLQISKPAEAQAFRQNDTVWILAKAAYVSQLHGYALQLTDTANKTVYLDITEHVHGSSFDIDTFWVNTAKAGSALQLQLTAEIDHEGNEKTSSVHFTSQL
ncbi:MAG: hypothetical protein JNL13_06630 [Chitinophagaceae bacterium]|nr:hypothetical protein [Chitinophagaceae bacterium]